jgi:hypothetical protein
VARCMKWDLGAGRFLDVAQLGDQFGWDVTQTKNVTHLRGCFGLREFVSDTS